VSYKQVAAVMSALQKSKANADLLIVGAEAIPK
jgi:hypothetical protein